jgi:type IV secretion system protein VirD4
MMGYMFFRFFVKLFVYCFPVILFAGLLTQIGNSSANMARAVVYDIASIFEFSVSEYDYSYAAWLAGMAGQIGGCALIGVAGAMAHRLGLVGKVVTKWMKGIVVITCLAVIFFYSGGTFVGIAVSVTTAIAGIILIDMAGTAPELALSGARRALFRAFGVDRDRGFGGGPWKDRWWNIEQAAARLSDENGVILGEAYEPQRGTRRAGQAQLLRWAPTGSLITIAPSGSGKDTAVVMPNAAYWNGPLLIQDPAGEVYQATHRARWRRGRRIARLGEDKDAWGLNLLDALRPDDTELIEKTRALVAQLPIAGGAQATQAAQGSQNQVFEEQAKALITCLILYVVCEEDLSYSRTLPTVRTLLTAPHLKELLEHLSGRTDLAHGAVADLAGGVLQAADSDEVMASIFFTASAGTSFLLSPVMDRLIGGNVQADRRLRIDDIVNGDVDVFLTLSARLLRSQPEIPRLLWSTIINAILERDGVGTTTLLLLNEFPLIGHLAPLETARDFGRKYGLITWVFAQNVGQIEKTWGQHGARAWLGSPKCQQFFGITDHESAKKVSDAAGETTTRTESISENTGEQRSVTNVAGSTNAGESRSAQAQKVELIRPREVMDAVANSDGLPLEQFIFLQGRKPLRCGLAHHFNRADMQAIETTSFTPRDRDAA